MSERLLTPRQVAARLGIGPNAVYYMLKTGALRSVRLPGRKRRFAIESEVAAMKAITYSDSDYKRRLRFIRRRQAGDLYGDLRRLQTEAGLTISELAGIAGLSVHTVRMATIHEGWKRCSVAALERMAEALGYEVRWALARIANRAGTRVSALRRAGTPQSDPGEARSSGGDPGSLPESLV